MNDTSTAPCHLLAIPPELRLQIYEHYFGEPKTCFFAVTDENAAYYSWDYNHLNKSMLRSSASGLTLLLCCRKIHQEAQPLLMEGCHANVVVNESPYGSWKGGTSMPAWNQLELMQAWRYLKLFPCMTITVSTGRDVERILDLTRLFIEAMDRCRAVKKLTLLLYYKRQLRRPERLAALMDVLKGIQCYGMVDMARNGSGLKEEYDTLVQTLRVTAISFPK